MKRISYISLAVALCLTSLSLSAQQNLRSGYFLDGYTYKYKMNPAMAPNRGFFAMPLLGNVGIGMESNLGLSDFLYPTESGRLTTFLSPRVSNEEFLRRVEENNKFNTNLDLGLIAFGFRTGKCYHTFDVSARIDGGMNIPGGFFRFMKVGAQEGMTAWDISNIGMRMSARAEIAYGLSRSFLDESLRIGVRAKLLLGIIRADIAMDKMSMEMSSSRWAIEAHGQMHASAPMPFSTKGENGNAESPDQNNIVDWSNFSMADIMKEGVSPSYGFAFDLGATYDFLDYFTASLAFLDMGAMSWKNSMTAETPTTSWEFTGFESADVDHIGEQLSKMTEDMMSAFNFEMKEREITHTAPLAMTINAGIEARMPFYERLSFGLLYTQRIEGAFSWSEGRLAASVTPVNFLSLTTNYAFSHFGHSWGGALNLNFPGFGIFLGMDSFAPLLNVTPQFIPVNSINTNLAFGINFNFGKYHGRFTKKDKE